MLAARGAVVIDADRLAREVVAPGTPGFCAVVDEFGAEVLGSDGDLDRARLGRVVFADPVRRAALNAIVHPLVAQRSAELMAAAAPESVVVYDVPLLVENDLAGHYELVVVVDAAESVRLERLTRDRGMSAVDARARMAAQADRERRLAVADVVVTNDGTREELEHQVAALWESLRSRT
jgi:dephospho-CoA kinase